MRGLRFSPQSGGGGWDRQLMRQAMGTGRDAGRFDAWKLAASRATLAGRVDPWELPRLEDRVADAGGSVEWSIAGVADAQGRPAISVSVGGHIPLVCQRCLGALDQPLEQSTRLLLARDDAELVRLDEASEDEVVLADAPLDPLALVEDELLLTLPFAPRHEAACEPRAADE